MVAFLTKLPSIERYWQRDKSLELINKSLANVNSLEGFKKACKRIGETDLDERSAAYYFNLVMCIVSEEKLHWFELADYRFLTSFRHPAFHFPRQSLWRARLSLQALLFFDEPRCAELDKHLEPKRLKQKPGDLIEYLYYQQSPLLHRWRQAMLKRELPLSLWVGHADYVDGVHVVKEAREDIVDLTDERTHLLAAIRLINCHAIFIFHPQSSRAYVAHINPSQAENRHFMFGHEVPCFTKIKTFIDEVGFDCGYHVYVFDHKDFHKQAIHRLDRVLKANGVLAYAITICDKKNSRIGELAPSEQQRFSMIYDIKRQRFFALHQHKLFDILNLNDEVNHCVTCVL